MATQATTMDVRPCGSQGLKLSAQGFGCMSLTKGFYASAENAPSKEDAQACLLRARELGVTFYNSSNLYGPYTNEELIGETIKDLAPRPTIMTKWGPLFKPGQGWEGGLVHHTDRKWARESIEGQLQRLGVDCIDLWVLRGFVESETSVEETMAGVKELMHEGKFKYFGLSECSPDQIRRAHAIVPVTALEIEWSLWERQNEADVIPLARKLGIGIVPWGPMGTGFLTGAITSRADLKDGDFRKAAHGRMTDESFDKNMKLVERLRALADRKGCTPAQLALAWVHAQGEDVFPIPGTKRVKYLEQNVAAYAISKTLTKSELSELEAAVPADEVHGKANHSWRAAAAAH